MSRSHVTSVNLTAEDKAELDRQMSELDIHNRSEVVRICLRARSGKRNPNRKPGAATGAAAADPAIDGTRTAALVRKTIAEKAGVAAGAGADYPGMGVAGHDLALVLSDRHMDDILAGTFPAVEDDAAAAGLDPYGKEAWEMYTATLPRFFAQLFGMERPPAADIRFEPLASVDGQYAGAVRGKVVSRDHVYPDGDGAKFVKLVVLTAGDKVPVLVPAGMFPAGAVVGAEVYAAGTFTIVRQRVKMRVCKCIVERSKGFDSVYGLVEGWGASQAVATEAVLMLRELHGTTAAEMAPMFCQYVRMDRNTSQMEMFLNVRDGMRVWLSPNDIRSGQPDEDGIRECVKMWPDIVRRKGISRRD